MARKCCNCGMLINKTDHRARKDAKNPKKQQSEPEETSGE